ncbi:MAG: hypothetical protein LBP69_00735, partial [Treponema sp.]|nr:hypothetical protein [Treponema sp.]
MKKFFTAILLCVCAILTAEPGYFVSGQGSDNSSGLSETSPFKTLARALAAVQSARNGIRTIIIVGVLDGKDEPVVDKASVFCIKDSGPAEITIRGKNGAALLGQGYDFVLAGSPPEMQTAAGDPVEPDYSEGKRVISVMGNSRIRFAGIEISRGLADEGGGLLVSHGASVIMENGLIRSNAARSMGGGVFVMEHASFILRGGSIRGNTAVMGGGAAFHRGTCLIEDGDINANAGVHGGGLWSAYGSTIAFTGGEIAGNDAFDDGGGIAVHEASLTMAGRAALRNNRAPKGAGMYIEHGGYLPGQGVVMYGGIIENNETDGSGGGGSYNGGGGVYNDGVFTMRGGEIRRNKATGDYYAGRGGGIFVGREKSFLFSGGRIEENDAEKEGGGIYADAGSAIECVPFYPAVIVKNSAAYGGGIYIQQASVVMQSGSIAENKAVYLGGGVDVDGGIFEMRGGEISGNRVEESRITTDRGEVRRLDKKGGGVFLERRGIFRLYEGTVSRNVAGFGDAVMVVRGAAFEMYGGE